MFMLFSDMLIDLSLQAGEDDTLILTDGRGLKRSLCEGKKEQFRKNQEAVRE